MRQTCSNLNRQLPPTLHSARLGHLPCTHPALPARSALRARPNLYQVDSPKRLPPTLHFARLGHLPCTLPRCLPSRSPAHPALAPKSVRTYPALPAIRARPDFHQVELDLPCTPLTTPASRQTAGVRPPPAQDTSAKSQKPTPRRGRSPKRREI